MKLTKRKVLPIAAIVLLAIFGLGFPEASAQMGNSILSLVMQVLSNTEAIKAKTDALPSQPSDQFQTGITKGIQGEFVADPAAGACSFLRLATEPVGSVISGRVGLISTADFAQIEGALGVTRFPFASVGQFADPPSVSTNAGFISDGNVTAVI